VVVVTSSSAERDLVESYRLGVNGYIVKPVDFGRFLDAIKVVGIYWLTLNRVVLSDGSLFAR
jgi:two-component system response regulator